MQVTKRPISGSISVTHLCEKLQLCCSYINRLLLETTVLQLLLRSEIPSGMCAELRTMAASNNRDHPRSLSSSLLASTINCSPGSQALLEVTHQDHSIGITLRVRYCYVQSLVSPEITRHDHSFIACSRHIHIFLFFAHIPFVMNHAINATPPERLQQHPLLFTRNCTDRMFIV